MKQACKYLCTQLVPVWREEHNYLKRVIPNQVRETNNFKHLKRISQRLITCALYFVIGLLGFNPAFCQGKETFENLSLSGNRYSDGTFTGQDGSIWTYTQCRGNKEITGNAIMIGQNRDPQSHFFSGTIQGGIGSLCFDYMQAYKTNINLNVIINDVIVGTVTSSDETNTIKHSGNIAVNIAGDCVIKFINVKNTDGQAVIDNITWTAYGATSGHLSNLALSSDAAETGQEISITWEADNVAFVKVQIRDESGNEWFDLEGLQSIDATLGTLTFTLPTHMTEGTKVLRIVDTGNASIYAKSPSFILSDVHFAGLSPIMALFPANEAVDIPLDLFNLIRPHDEDPSVTIHQLIINFHEVVQAASGNISLYKAQNDELLATYSIAGPNVVIRDSTVAITTPENLDPNTHYRVAIDNGAVTDHASTPNLFDGNISWHFTTGDSDSFESIPEIRSNQAPPTPSGTIVHTGGIVSHIPDDHSLYWIEEGNTPYGGILVEDPATATKIQKGDFVHLVATIQKELGMTRLTDVIDIEVVSSEHPIEPLLITLPFQEKWEGMLVRINKVHFTGQTNSENGFEISDGNNTAQIGGLLYEHTPESAEQFKSISGLLIFSSGGFSLNPRWSEDLAYSAVGINNPKSKKIMASPNPVSNTLFITSPEPLSTIRIVNTASTLIKRIKTPANRQVTIQMENLPPGLYMVHLMTLSGHEHIKKVIKR